MPSLNVKSGYYLLFSSLIWVSCQQRPQQQVKPKPQGVNKEVTVSAQEEHLVKLIMNLEEVKRKSAIIEQESKGKRHLATYVETLPTADDPNYWIKVAEDNGGSYVTYYTFAVDGKTQLIRYYDVMQDSLLSLEQWRQSIPAGER